MYDVLQYVSLITLMLGGSLTNSNFKYLVYVLYKITFKYKWLMKSYHYACSTIPCGQIDYY